MNKIIGILSVCAMFGFASAAHADDSMSNVNQQPGSVSDQTQGMMDSAKETTKETTTKTKESAQDTVAGADQWKTAKSCTDSAGVTYERGKKGFSKCVDEMRKKDQMGGEAGSMDSSKSHDSSSHSTDSSSSTNSN